MTSLPVTSFAEVAVDMYLVASEQARGLAALEGNGLAISRAGEEAQCDHEARARVWSVYEAALLEARRTAVASDAAHQLIKAIAPYESQIRALVDLLSRSKAA